MIATHRRFNGEILTMAVSRKGVPGRSYDPNTSGLSVGGRVSNEANSRRRRLLRKRMAAADARRAIAAAWENLE